MDNEAAIKIDQAPPASITIKNLEEDNLELSTNTGVNLNSLLPPNSVIKYSENDEFYTIVEDGDGNPNRLFIPKHFNSLGNTGKACFAHEVGHLFHQIDSADGAKLFQFSYYSNKMPDKLSSLSLGIDFQNICLPWEVECWNYGLPIAASIGVEDEEYQSTMNLAIESYQYSILAWQANKATQLPDSELPSPDQFIDIYQIQDQEKVRWNYKEYIEHLKRERDHIVAHHELAANKITEVLKMPLPEK